MKSANILLARDLTAKIAVRAGAGCLSMPRDPPPSTCQVLRSCSSMVGCHATPSPPDPFSHAELR